MLLKLDTIFKESPVKNGARVAQCLVKSGLPNDTGEIVSIYMKDGLVLKAGDVINVAGGRNGLLLFVNSPKAEFK